MALPLFHSLTGCDIVSFVHGKGKKSVWYTQNSLLEITNTFLERLDNPESIDLNMKMIERFVILLYDRTSSEDEVNTAGKIMFANKGREMDKIQPTKDALVQHSRRAIWQASFVWHHMSDRQSSIPSPSEWGWE